MAYSTNGGRLFSCGVGMSADTTLVEWNESDGAIARRYTGFKNNSGSLTRFDTAANKYLIVGDDHSVKARTALPVATQQANLVVLQASGS